MATSHTSGRRTTTSAFVVIMLGGTLPVPLYTLWSSGFGFGALTTTLLFALYALGTVVALAVLGSLSDQAGRRPVLLAALVLAALSTLLFVLATDVVFLAAARFLSGVAAGMATAAATAALAELSPPGSTRGQTLGTAGNLGGLALGPPIAGVFAQYLFAPTVLVYWVYLAVLALAVVLVVLTPETVARPHRPHVSLHKPLVPSDPGERTAFLGAAAFMFAGFAVTGLFASLVPQFLRQGLGQDNLAVVGAVVGLLFAVGMLAQLVAGASWMPSTRITTPSAMVAGLVLVVVGLLAQQLGVFVAGTVVTGAGFGLAARTGVTAGQQLGDDANRSDLIATMFVVAYVGTSISTIGVGVLTDLVSRDVAVLAVSALVTAAVVAAALLQGRRAPGGQGSGGQGSGDQQPRTPTETRSPRP